MQRIMQIGVVSLGKVMGLSGLLIGLIVGIPYGLVLMLMGVAGGASGQEGAGAFAAMGIGGGLFVMVVFPLFYGVVCFIGGLIYALVLNLVLWMAGGLELEIRQS